MKHTKTTRKDLSRHTRDQKEKEKVPTEMSACCVNIDSYVYIGNGVRSARRVLYSTGAAVYPLTSFCDFIQHLDTGPWYRKGFGALQSKEISKILY